MPKIIHSYTAIPSDKITCVKHNIVPLSCSQKKNYHSCVFIVSKYIFILYKYFILTDRLNTTTKINKDLCLQRTVRQNCFEFMLHDPLFIMTT